MRELLRATHQAPPAPEYPGIPGIWRQRRTGRHYWAKTVALSDADMNAEPVVVFIKTETAREYLPVGHDLHRPLSSFRSLYAPA